MMRIPKLLAIFLALAMILVACGTEDAETPTAVEDESVEDESDDEAADAPADDDDVVTVRFGVAMPLTGTQAALGEEFVRWFERGVERVNADNDRFDLEMVVEDTRATAEVGLTALNRLGAVEDVPVVFTAWSGVVQAMAPVAVDLDVALINSGANDPLLAGVGELINMFPLASVDIQALATWAREVQGYERAAIIFIDNPTGEGAADLYEEVFSDLGGEVVAVEAIRMDAADASAQVARVAAADPDIVHIHVLAAEAPVIIQELEAQGVDADMSTYSLAEFTQVRASAGPAMAGLYYGTFTPLQTPELGAEVEWYEENFADSPAISYGVYQHGGPFLLASVVNYLLDEGREITGDSISAAILEISEFELPHIGEIVIREDGTISLPVRIKQVGEDPTQGAADDEIVYEVDPDEVE